MNELTVILCILCGKPFFESKWPRLRQVLHKFHDIFAFKVEDK